MKNHITIAQFSSHLFWDVDESILNFEKSKAQIIFKVLEYGLLQDWILLKEVYTLEEIKNVSVQLKSLDVITLSFLSHFFKIDKSEFRCFKQNQLTPNYWNS